MNPLTESQLMVNRRQFFGRTATGIGAAALGNLLQQDGLAGQTGGAFGGLGSLPHFAPKAKRVIYLFMNGAPTHTDLYDYKPLQQQLHGKPVPQEFVAGKRFSTMTGNPQGKLMLAPVEPFKQHGQSGAWVSNFMPHVGKAADDICYTIIDFEDGINLGLIDEAYALEYLIKLVKPSIDTHKYHQLRYKKDRLSYLRALAIGTLIKEACEVFLANEKAILEGKYPYSLLDKCRYEAQINDILTLSVEKIYKSRNVIEKELAGYRIIAGLLSVFLDAVNHRYENNCSNYDKLVLHLLPENLQNPPEDLYQRIVSVCGFVASLTDGFAKQLYQKIMA